MVQAVGLPSSFRGMLCNWWCLWGRGLARMDSLRRLRQKWPPCWMPVSVGFSTMGFEHSIVNMFLVSRFSMIMVAISLHGLLVWTRDPKRYWVNLAGGLFH